MYGLGSYQNLANGVTGPGIFRRKKFGAEKKAGKRKLRNLFAYESYQTIGTFTFDSLVDGLVLANRSKTMRSSCSFPDAN